MDIMEDLNELNFDSLSEFFNSVKNFVGITVIKIRHEMSRGELK